MKPNSSSKTISTVETITPEMARQWLALNTANRPINEGRVIHYALQMEEGKWALNGETIKFAADGHLIDGQHRLRACELSGVSFQTYVVRNIEDERAFATVDVGEVRNHGDIFHIAGYKDQANAAAIAMVLHNYGRNSITLGGMAGTKKLISKYDLLQWAEPQRQAIDDACVFSNVCTAKKFVRKSLIGALYLVFSAKGGRAASESFFNDLGDGVGLTKTDPVYHLRERLIENATAREKLPRQYEMALIIKAWNKRRAKEATRQLRIADNEEFPRAK